MATNQDAESLNDLYQKWLEIPASRLPPNHYALLALDDFESDRSLIEQALKKRNTFLHEIAAGPQRKAVQELLGQVALARRTLLDAESKRQYDQTLRAQAAAKAQAQQRVAQSNAPQAGGGANETNPSKLRSRNAGAWKYHAISATVLLLIVGLIWLANRGGGGRKAASAQKLDESSGQVQAKPTPKATLPVVEKTETRPQRSTRVVAPKATGQPPPPVKPRKRGAELKAKSGSGLLGGDSEMANFIASMNKKDSANSESPSEKNVGNPVEPAKDSDQSDGSFIQLPDDWRSGLTKIEEFPGDIEKQFKLANSEKCYVVSENDLVVTSGKKSAVQRLTERDASVEQGYVVSMTVKLSPKVKPTQEFGFEIGEIVIGAKPDGKRLSLFSQVVGKPNTRQPISSIPLPDGEFRFSIVRPTSGDSTLRWLVDGKSGDHTGLVERIKLINKEICSLFFHAPSGMEKDSMRLSELMVGKLKSIPDWE